MMLDTLLPHGSVYATTPIYRYAARRIRWTNSTPALIRFIAAAVLVATVALAALWGLVVWLQIASMRACFEAGGYYCEGAVWDNLNLTLGIMLLASIGAGWLMDFACVLAAFNSIRGRVDSSHWDLLRLTPLREEVIVRAEYAVAQVRALRSAGVVFGLRIASVIVLLLQWLLLPTLIAGAGGEVYDGGYNDPDYVLLLIGFIAFFAVYLVEPFWRMAAVTALGLAVAARFRGIVSAGLAAFGALVTMWIAQAIIMSIIFGCSFSIAFVLEYFYPLCASAGTGALIFVFYMILRQEAIKHAIQRAFRD